MSAQTPRRPSFIPAVIYQDNRAALKWLQEAFGFEVSELLADANDNIAHAEMSYGDGIVMIGSEWADWTRSPASLGGKNTQRIHVRVEHGIDEHCARARQAGAKIAMEPADQFYGERSYIAIDLEGHHWTFSQSIKQVSGDELTQVSGFVSKKLA
jgi:uncharacterized glyoxalase superfamily protein PhnB